MSGLDMRCGVFLEKVVYQRILEEVDFRVAQDAERMVGVILGVVHLLQRLRPPDAVFKQI